MQQVMQGPIFTQQTTSISNLKKALLESPKLVGELLNHPNGLLAKLIEKLVNLVENDIICNGLVQVKIEAMKLLQDLSIVASSGYESVFNKVINCIITNTLPQNE